ncbi:UNVERIFIED_ORG: hypothetical protein GGD51_005143 [Rhizobium esperanzae]
MRNQTASSIHFHRKIAEFCDVRLAPLVSKRTLDNIKPYLTSLIIYRKHPPMRMNGVVTLFEVRAHGSRKVDSGELQRGRNIGYIRKQAKQLT